MSLLSRLRSFVSSLFVGADEEHDEPTPEPEARSETVGAAPEPEPTYRCSICGTPVEDPEEGCPLCRSSDVVPADAVEDADADTAHGGDDEGASVGGARVTRAGDDDAVNRLTELRERTAEGESPTSDGESPTSDGEAQSSAGDAETDARDDEDE